MSNNALKEKASSTFYKVKFATKQHSPEIFVAAGILGVIASTIMACRASRNLDDILKKGKEEIEEVHKMDNDESLPANVKGQALTKAYVQTGLNITKLYAPSIALGTLSIASILASNDILRKRNLAIAAAYTTLDKSFKDYRQRVIEWFGDETDKKLRYNVQPVKIEEKVKDEETGKTKKTRKIVDTIDPDSISDYAVIFDSKSSFWENRSDFNLMFLKAQQAAFNDQLKQRGYVFLNEVYDGLGLPRTQAGQVVGWIYEGDKGGDNYIDFGISQMSAKALNDYLDGIEDTIVLDFNVDGVIIDSDYIFGGRKRA